MLVPVLSGSPPTTLLHLASTLNVGGAKEEIHGRCNIPVALQRLVCSGRVLEDSATLPQACLEGSEPLWLVSAADDFVVPAAVLASMFPSTGAAPSNLQDQEGAAIHIWRMFCLSVRRGTDEGGTWLPSDAERGALASAAASLDTQTAFFAPYACALLWDESNVGWANLRLKCLDEHSFVVHSGAGRTHSSRADVARVLPVGQVPIGQLTAVLQRSKDLIMHATAASKGKDKRIGAKGGRGHQKTPSFIFAIFTDVIKTLELDDASWLKAANTHPTLPRGGFTDVGVHSDAQHRDTTWPVVMAVVQDRLEAAGQPQLFRVAMAQLRLWVTEHAVAGCVGAAGGEIDAVMLMLGAAAADGAAISDAEQQDMAFFAARVAVVRHELERASGQAAERAAEARELPTQLALSDFVNPKP
ncbi:hypothetical protein T484DRAFT_1869778 [Baffinella frigidus]|nr:hypothetical protein T484DRAFT_1869778 [Cryptophyta sp. CCMP2293]